MKIKVENNGYFHFLPWTSKIERKKMLWWIYEGPTSRLEILKSLEDAMDILEDAKKELDEMNKQDLTQFERKFLAKLEKFQKDWNLGDPGEE